MAFRRANRPTYYIGPLTAGGIHVPRLTTGVTNRMEAESMEKMLHTLARSGHADLVRQVAERRLAVHDLYNAFLLHQRPNRDGDRNALEALRERDSDPLLADVVLGERDPRTRMRSGGYRATVADGRVRSGLDQLLALVPENARLSWLRDPRNLSALYRRALQGEDRKGRSRVPNSVRRSLHRAVSELLTEHYGRGRMLAVMADTKVPAALDERNVMLSSDEIRRAIELADEEFRPVLGYAVTTGVDRGPMLSQRVHHYDEASGQLSVPDTKTGSRWRTLALRDEPVLENAEFWLWQLVAGKRSNEPLVALTPKEIRGRWEAIREALGRPDVRWKDLRGIFATNYLLAEGQPRELQRILGHSTMAMTLRYLNHLPAGNRKALREQACSTGLPAGTHLTVQKGSAA